MAKERITTAMERDAADLRVLYLGGTGRISASCGRLSVEGGVQVSVIINCGRNDAGREAFERYARTPVRQRTR